jgi:Tfp pilus assembly PilM family ATPase
MKNTSKTISGLDIQREYMSVAQYSRDENAVLLVAIQPVSIIPGGDLGEQIADDLKELRNKFKFTSPDIVCALPSEYASVKHLQIDNDDTNPEESLKWELGQQLVSNIDDYLFDFQENMQKTPNLKDYLAVAYRQDTIAGISNVLRKVKLNPVVIDLDIFALVNVFEANYKEKLEFPSVIIHSESDKTKLILCRNGEFIDFECFIHDANISDPYSFAERTRVELDKLLSINYSVLEDNPVGIYLTGSMYAHDQHSEVLISKLGNGEILDPFKNIGCRIGVDQNQLQAVKSQLAVAVGLAYRGNM